MRKIFYILIIPLVLTVSCEFNNEESTVAKVNREIYYLMKDVYFWNYNVPNLDATSFSNPYDLLNNLMYPQYDRWSSLLTVDEYQSYFEEGTMVGFGFMPGLDNEGKVRIAMLYRNTEMHNNGVRRGWIIEKVNGVVLTAENYSTLMGPATVGLQKNFEFTDNGGNPVALTITKAEINLTPVLHYETLNYTDKKIGYVVFQDFIETAFEELDEAFDLFTAEGIDEIIVDLRYNGGGRNDVAEYLGGLLIGRNYGDQPFVKIHFNRRYSMFDTIYNVPSNPGGIDVDRVFFIGTENTASASELVINGVQPYVPSILTGDYTHGKPVGMISFFLEEDDYVLLPITFKYNNADDEGDFYEGLAPQILATDDITRDFGDTEEEALAAVLNYISGGAPFKSAPSGRTKILVDDKPINQFLKAY